MLTRRQLRIKVMQTVFAFQRQRPNDLKDLEKFLNGSMAQSFSLLLYMIQLLVELRTHAIMKQDVAANALLANNKQTNPNRSFVDNKILVKIADSPELKEALDKRKLNPWHLHLKYVERLYEVMVNSKEYIIYTSKDETSIKEDLSFLTWLYAEIIAPDDQIFEFIEDENITWADDFPMVNTTVINFLRKVKPSKDVVLPELIKDKDDVSFTMDLFRRTVLNEKELLARIEGKTPNWEQERIAQIDLILIMMAQAEMLYFPSIPVKVTLNEYLEIAKDYSSPKSNIFVNGIVDNLLKEFELAGTLNKIGRGLM